VEDRVCSGFRTTAIEDVGRVAGPSSESLQRKNPREMCGGAAACAMGIFGAVAADVTAADVAGGVIVRRRGVGDAARDTWQRELDADLSFAGLAI
jgi:hypothetical protein